MLRKDIKHIPIPKFTTGNQAVAAVEIRIVGGKGHIIIASIYLHGNEDNLSLEAIKCLVEWCKRNNRHYILGCDANVNIRGKQLLEYL